MVYLEIMSRRASSGRCDHRSPLLNGGDPKAKYHALMRRRRPLYRQVATIRMRTDSRSPSRVVQQLVTKLTDGPAPGTPAHDETEAEQ